jgi:hypothetical protein
MNDTLIGILGELRGLRIFGLTFADTCSWLYGNEYLHVEDREPDCREPAYHRILVVIQAVFRQFVYLKRNDDYAGLNWGEEQMKRSKEDFVVGSKVGEMPEYDAED